MSEQCACRSCRQSIDFKVLEEALPDTLKPLLENIQSDLVHTNLELGYANALLENKWPNATQHMEKLGWVRIVDNITSEGLQ